MHLNKRRGSIGHLDIPLEPRFLLLVKNEIGREWKDLGRILGINEVELDHIELNTQDHMDEMAYRVLQEWIKKVDPKPTVSSLTDILKSFGRRDLAQKMEALIVSSLSSQNEDTRATNMDDFQRILYLGDIPLEPRIILLVKNEVSSVWKDLGRILGINEVELEHIELNMQGHTDEMAYSVLQEWIKKENPRPTVSNLTGILKSFGRRDLAEKMEALIVSSLYSQNEDTRATNRDDFQPMLQPGGILDFVKEEHAIEQHLGQLRRHLIKSYSNLRINGLTWIDDAWTNLSFEEWYVDVELSRCTETKRAAMALVEVFKAEKNETEPTRIIIEGPAGYGKTTLASKLCYDWASKKHDYIQDFDFVLLLPLRQFTGNFDTLLTKATLGYLSNVGLLWSMLTNQSKSFLLILDGIDEIDEEHKGMFHTFITGDMLSRVTMIITSKPEGKCAKDVGHSRFNVTPRYVSIEGVNKSQQKIFLSAHAGKEYPRLEKMCSSPLHLMMVTALLKLHERSLQKICTRVDLYKAAYNFMIQRYVNNLRLMLHNKENVDEKPGSSDYQMNVQPIDFFQFDEDINPELAQQLLQAGNIVLKALDKKSHSSVWKAVQDGVMQANPFGWKASTFCNFFYNLVFKIPLVQTFIYEPIHMTMMEFAGAYYLWVKNKKALSSEVIERSTHVEGVCSFLDELTK